MCILESKLQLGRRAAHPQGRVCDRAATVREGTPRRRGTQVAHAGGARGL